MIESVPSRDASNHLDHLVQMGRQAVREAQQRSREMGVANVYSINGELYYEMPSGEFSLTPPAPPRTAT